jgi:hypothetical protein
VQNKKDGGINVKLTVWSRGSQGFSPKGGYHPGTVRGYGSLWEINYNGDFVTSEKCIVSNMSFDELEGKALEDTIWYYKNAESIDIVKEQTDPSYGTY